jgi:hypothetical protein
VNRAHITCHAQSLLAWLGRGVARATVRLLANLPAVGKTKRDNLGSPTPGHTRRRSTLSHKRALPQLAPVTRPDCTGNRRRGHAGAEARADGQDPGPGATAGIQHARAEMAAGRADNGRKGER